MALRVEEGELRFACSSGEDGAFRVDSRGVPLNFGRRSGSGVTTLQVQDVEVAPEGGGVPPVPAPRITVESGAAEAADDQGGAPREGSAPRDR